MVNIAKVWRPFSNRLRSEFSRISQLIFIKILDPLFLLNALYRILASSKDGNVIMTWTLSPGATVYYVYRSTSFITTISGLIPVITTGDNYTQDTVTQDGTYYYAIVAGSPLGNRSISNCQGVVVAIEHNPLETPPDLSWIWLVVSLIGGAVALGAFVVVKRKRHLRPKLNENQKNLKTSRKKATKGKNVKEKKPVKGFWGQIPH